MQNILVLGAGMSSASLIKYLLDHSEEKQWKVRVGDLDVEKARAKVGGHKNGEAFEFNVFNDAEKKKAIAKADVVIYLLPAEYLYLVAGECVEQQKHMVSSAYVSKEERLLDDSAKTKGVALLNEIGLDPGIDHMMAMKIIDEIHGRGGKIKGFRFSTGGLLAPDSDDNPWNYKFTWNPGNVITAGKGFSRYMEKDCVKYVPYQQLFRRTKRVSIQDVGAFEVYANRDSLKYKALYGLEDVSTIFRGTLRRPGYCEAWDVLVQLGLTEDAFHIENSASMTYREWMNAFLPYSDIKTPEEKVAEITGLEMDSEAIKKIEWLGLFEEERIGLDNATPAQILQQRLEQKWFFGDKDRDMVAMQHVADYELDGQQKRLTSTMVVYGENPPHTAMAKTVGLSLAITAEMLLSGRIKLSGIHIPTTRKIYEPVLEKLREEGIKAQWKDEEKKKR
ncbi:MAG: saccharopine dehydrogenase NADP-binding domain-containing protein [Bacteroidales bacterium]|nr:saccharopine dehydrogenase NADP-binding domain-containing protein [Bacteroidales bacterium]MCF8334310.1 saccharopine dehydrogenase NADP-binding domain-containing protein [Bacteroidales bacterium]